MKPKKDNSVLMGAFRQNIIAIGFAVVMAFAISAIFLIFLEVNPIDAFVAILKGAFGTAYGRSEVLAKAIPLLIMSIGVTLAFKGGMSNLGGDGQFYFGALAAVLVGLYATALPYFLRIILAILASMVAGGLWGGLAGWMKAHLKTSEVIITIMLNYVAIYMVGYLINGPFRAPGGIPQTRALDEGLHLMKLMEGGRVHAGLFIAIAIVLFIWWVFAKTVPGYKIQTVGSSAAAAEYAGIPTKRYYAMIMVCSGSIAGIAGMVEVYGVHYRVLEGISTDFGFTAILVALLGRLHPVGIIVGSLAISVLSVGANSMQITMAVPTAIATVVQSLLIFFMLIAPSIIEKSSKYIKDKQVKKQGDI